MLEQHIFAELEADFGPFDIDGAANEDGGNAQCADYCFKGGRSFLEEDIRGKKIYLNPPFKSAKKFLNHYHEAKADDPSTTGLFILPYEPNANWWELTEGMKLVRSWRAGTQLFTLPTSVPGERRVLGVCPFDVVAMYDGPESHGGHASTADDKAFILDSGASEHMIFRKEMLHDYRDWAPGDPCTVKIGNRMRLPVEGVGTLVLQPSGYNREATVELQDVLYVPQLHFNLISMAKLADEAATMEVTKTAVTAKMGDGYELRAIRDGNLFQFSDCVAVLETSDASDGVSGYIAANGHLAGGQGASGTAGAAALPAGAIGQEREFDQVEVWHKRMGHMGYSTLIHLPDVADGVNIDTDGVKQKLRMGAVCEDCELGKMTRDGRAERARPASTVKLHRLHVDLCGPLHEPTLGGKRYFLGVTDEATKYSTFRLLEHKDDTANALKQLINQLERQATA
jgi:hypothetical protein